MIRSAIRRYLTSTRDVPGTWRRKGPTEIEDSSLGICRTDPYDDGGLFVSFERWGEVRVSINFGKDAEKTIAYARSLLVHFPKQDFWYRQFGARDIYRAHQVLGPIEKISVRELARELKISSFELLNPCVQGATLWYRAGHLLGGGRLGVTLDPCRRYSGSAIG